MADPFTILCSILTIAGASKKVPDACTHYTFHAKNAPKELRLIVEDINALTATLKELDKVAKSAQKSHERTRQFNEWAVPLKRLEGYVKDLTELLGRQNMKIGIFHQLTFRTRWPSAWRDARALLDNIAREKSNIHLDTSIYSVALLERVFELVEERLPADRPDYHLIGQSAAIDIRWYEISAKSPIATDENASILKRVGSFIGWDMAQYEYPYYEDSHHFCLQRFNEYTSDHFLRSHTYQAWKTRRTPGPGLLWLRGPPHVGKTILCSQIIEDLKGSNNTRCGVVYTYFNLYPDGSDRALESLRWPDEVLSFWIMQLALQFRVLPRFPDHNARHIDTQYGLMDALSSLLPKFRRTFFVIDGLDGSRFGDDLTLLVKDLLGQEHGNVSVLLTSRDPHPPTSLVDLADVSIRITLIDPNIQQYVHNKVRGTIRAAMLRVTKYATNTAQVLDEIEKVILEASDGLYLAVDVLTDSVLEAVRTHLDISAFLRNIRENNEIMLQRDPEVMKQKVFVVDSRYYERGPVTKGEDRRGT